MATTAELYDKDFVRWTEEQARALRHAAAMAPSLPLDWENLAEEVESLGGSTRNELGSRLAVVIEHLLKLQHSPANDPRRGWADTVFRERARVDSLLAKSPSLRREMPDIFEDEFRRTKRLTLTLLDHYGEADPAVRAAVAATDYTIDQVLGDWLPQRASRA